MGSRRQFGKSPKSRFNFITMGSCFDSFFFGGHFFAPKDNIIEDPLSHGLAYGGCWICLAIRTQADGLNSFFPPTLLEHLVEFNNIDLVVFKPD